VTGPGDPKIEPPHEAAPILSAFYCNAQTKTSSLKCDPAPDPLRQTLPSFSLGIDIEGATPDYMLIGGQHSNIDLTSSNIAVDNVLHRFSFDVTVRNLRPQPIGTADGATSDSSLSVFFLSGPTTTGGTGTITVANPTSFGTFTAPGQAYFKYGERLVQNATSAPKNWILQFDSTVTSFSFLLLVNASVQHPDGYIDVFPASGGIAGVGATLQMTDSVRDALGVVTADQSETWSLSDSSKATINAAGLLTGVSPGTVIVTATQGLKTGSASIQVTGTAPTAVADSSASNSSPGVAYHAAFNTQYNPGAPALLSNDNVGAPAATVLSYGGGSLGGAVTDHAAGTTTGHGSGGSLTVNSNGSLSFTPSTGFTGYFTFSYRLGNAVGSSDATVRIAVGVRDSAISHTYPVSLVGNVAINTATSTQDTVKSSGDGLTYAIIDSVGGRASINAATKRYTFSPNPAFTGAGSFRFTVTNGFGADTGVVTLNVGPTVVWFVDSAAAGGGDGRKGSPFNCLVGVSGCFNGSPNAAGHVIYLASGTYRDSDLLSVKNNQRVIGQGAAGNFADAANANVTWPADAGAQPAVAGRRPKINSDGAYVFNLQSGNTLTGLVSGNASVWSIIGSSIGTFTMNNAAIANTTGGALSLSVSGTLAVAVDSITGFTTSGEVINLSNQAGTLTSGVTRARNTSGTGILVQNSAGFNFGATKVTMTTSGNGVQLTNNTGTTTFTSLIDSTSNGQALVTSSAGTVHIDGGLLWAQGVRALNATNTAFSGTGFSSTTTSLLLQEGVFLSGVSGTLALGSGSIEAATDGLRITGNSSGTVTYSGSITNSARPVNISNASAGSCPTVTLSGRIKAVSNGILVQNCNAGTITFSGPDTVSVTSNKGVQLASNTGATINFTGGATAVTTTTGNAFEATGGGTISVTGANNSLASAGGVALNVTSTAIGASGLTFRSISANGGTSGIVMNGTGSTAGLTVTGVDGACGWTGSAVTTVDCDGGTIQNTTSRGASFINASNISLKFMNFNNTATVDAVPANTGLSLGNNLSENAAIHLQTVTDASFDRIVINGSSEEGINGNTVTNFTLSNSSLLNTGNGPDEDGLHFYNMLGTNAITATSIVSSGDDNVNIQNASGTSSIAVTGGRFNTGVLGSGLLFGPRGTTNTTITISGVTSDNNFSGGIVADASDGATMRLEVSGSSSTNNANAISLSGANGNVQFDIHDNISFAGTDNGVINVLKAAFSTGGTLQGRIRNNPIVVSNGQVGDGIGVFQAGAGALNVAITNNTITYGGTQRAMLLQAGQDGAGTLDATVTGNAINVQLDGSGDAVTGILAQVAVASPSGNNSSMCMDIGGAGGLGNLFTHSLGGTLAGGDIRMRQRFVTTAKLRGYAGANNDNAAVVSYLAGRNTLANSPAATATNEAGVTPGAGGFVNTPGGSGCAQPTFP
jgi:hypothetical protein